MELRETIFLRADPTRNLLVVWSGLALQGYPSVPCLCSWLMGKKGFSVPLHASPLSQLSGIAVACPGPHAQAVRRRWQVSQGMMLSQLKPSLNYDPPFPEAAQQ